MTVKEFLLEGILESYNTLKSMGIIKNPYPDIDQQFYSMIMAGRADLQLIVWKYIQDRKGSGHGQMNDYNETEKEEFNEAYNNFLCKEINRLKGMNTVQDLFKDIEFTQDELEKVQVSMMPYLKYKFQRIRKRLILNRLTMMTQLSIVEGPDYIQTLLEKFKF